MGKGAGGSAVEPLPPITARTDAATVIVPVPPVGQRRPTSGGGGGGTPGGGGSGVSGRPGSGGVRRAPSRPGSGGGGGGDVEALAEEVRELESKLQRAAKRRGSGDQQRPRSAPRSPARVAAADESADFQQLLAQVRKESQATLVAMDSAGAQKGSLQQQVAALQEQLKQVTIKEMDIVEQLSVELKENVELKKSLAKCEEELAVQRALNDEELGMVDELASMEEERNRLRVDVEKLRAAAAPLQETITELQEDKTELAQLLQQSEARIKVLGDQLQGGAELFDNKEKELRAFEAETAEKLRFLDKKITSLEEDLSTTQETLATTQATLERTEAELELTKKTAAAAAATAAAQYADMTAQYEKVADIVASTKAKCEEEVAHARSDRTIIVKELRRLQEKERETRDINAVRRVCGWWCPPACAQVMD
jgi:chromosome segregation ATPase